jgi:hypothetical protein
MTITITAFERSPDCGKGLARDMRVRWSQDAELRFIIGGSGQAEAVRPGDMLR